MEGLVMVLIVIIGLLALDLAAMRWGADSRVGIPDDHAR